MKQKVLRASTRAENHAVHTRSLMYVFQQRSLQRLAKHKQCRLLKIDHMELALLQFSVSLRGTRKPYEGGTIDCSSGVDLNLGRVSKIEISAGFSPNCHFSTSCDLCQLFYQNREHLSLIAATLLYLNQPQSAAATRSVFNFR
jgi:hypothetical protein